MKKVLITSLVVAMVLGTGIAFANPEGTPDAKRIYKLNIIGMQNPKNVNMDQGSGNVIFVNLDGKSQINLVDSNDPAVLAEYPELEEASFDVLDKDATDSGKQDPSPGAILALPNPDLDPYNTSDPGDADTDSAYTIVIRSLGKPGGSASITTCADLVDSDFAGLLSGKFLSILNKEAEWADYASVEQVPNSVTLRPKGKSIFTEVTAELLTIVFKVEVEIEVSLGVYETIIEYIRVPIFDPIIENEYWEYDNSGLKLLQVWFYDCPTDVSLDDGSWNNEPAPPA